MHPSSLFLKDKFVGKFLQIYKLIFKEIRTIVRKNLDSETKGGRKTTNRYFYTGRVLWLQYAEYNIVTFPTYDSIGNERGDLCAILTLAKR